jgi:hypothetical protein
VSLKQEALAVLQAQGDHKALLGVVRRHLAQGMPSRQVYDVLEEIWLGFGFDAKEGGGMQDVLEIAMEKVWYWGEGA